MFPSPAPGPKFPSAKNIGEVVRLFKNGLHVYRDPDAESTGIATDLIPLGFSMGVSSHPPQIGVHPMAVALSSARGALRAELSAAA